jgi:hypothetical protein
LARIIRDDTDEHVFDLPADGSMTTLESTDCLAKRLTSWHS